MWVVKQSFDKKIYFQITLCNDPENIHADFHERRSPYRGTAGAINFWLSRDATPIRATSFRAANRLLKNQLMGGKKENNRDRFLDRLKTSAHTRSECRLRRWHDLFTDCEWRCRTRTASFLEVDTFPFSQPSSINQWGHQVFKYQ